MQQSLKTFRDFFIFAKEHQARTDKEDPPSLMFRPFVREVQRYPFMRIIYEWLQLLYTLFIGPEHHLIRRSNLIKRIQSMMLKTY